MCLATDQNTQLSARSKPRMFSSLFSPVSVRLAPLLCSVPSVCTLFLVFCLHFAGRIQPTDTKTTATTSLFAAKMTARKVPTMPGTSSCIWIKRPLLRHGRASQFCFALNMHKNEMTPEPSAYYHGSDEEQCFGLLPDGIATEFMRQSGRQIHFRLSDSGSQGSVCVRGGRNDT